GRELLITAGGTREDLDPVRFLANHSSGRQGWALAHAALVRGARVRLAAANVELVTPPGARRLDVGSAAELADLVAAHRGEVRSGRELLITAGGTREDLDPVRFLANHSSGRQGWALAHAALVRGARVRLAAANVELVTPPGARRLDVGSAAELADLVAAHRGEVDAL